MIVHFQSPEFSGSENPTRLDPQRWFELYGGGLFAYAMSILRNRDLSEEVVQETFLAALRKIEQFQEVSSEGAWLMGIMKRKVIDQLRSSARQRWVIQNAVQETSTAWKCDGQKLEAEEFAAILEECLRELPSSVASVFVLKEVEQKSSHEVCQLLGITPSNLWVMMHRCRKGLAKKMAIRWGTQ